MRSHSQKEKAEFLERDIKVMRMLLDCLCRRELTDRGRRHIENLIKYREDDIRRTKSAAPGSKG